jgi:hypothetical protein
VKVRERGALFGFSGWLAFAIPLLVTLVRASAFTQWRDDLAIVRGLGFVPLAGEGTIAGLLTQAASLLPLGGRLLRASLVSALGLAICGRLVYALTARALEANATTPRLTPPLALAAALTATLSTSWQLEGTIAGGATIAAALALAGILLRPDPRVGDARVWLGFGALVATTALESHAAGVALAVALAAQVLVLGELPTRRSVALFGAGAAVAAALLLLPLLLRPLSGRAWVDLGYGLSSADVTAIDAAAEQTGAFAAWLREVGVVSLALALGGAAWALARRRLRWIAAPLAALAALDLAFPAARAGLLAADPLAPLRLLAVVSLASLAGIAVHTLALGLVRSPFPMARQAAVLLVAFDFTLVLVTGEDSAYVADRRSQHAAEIWTDEAIGNLPQRSLLLVRDPAVAWRLWSARHVRGERPDLVVVPVPLLARGSVAADLLREEPALAPLVRDLVISGRPSEYALSTLADARPLFVELDPSWDQRLMHHLVPRPLWLGFSPHALGRSDRNAALERGQRAFDRVLAAAKTADHRDLATLSILRSRAREQAVTLAKLGDRDSVQELLSGLREIDPDDAVAAQITSRMAASERGGVDVAGLIP